LLIAVYSVILAKFSETYKDLQGIYKGDLFSVNSCKISVNLLLIYRLIHNSPMVCKLRRKEIKFLQIYILYSKGFTTVFRYFLGISWLIPHCIPSAEGSPELF